MRSIRLEKLKKSISGGLIINDISLTIPAGKFFALLGPSGCTVMIIPTAAGSFVKCKAVIA